MEFAGHFSIQDVVNPDLTQDPIYCIIPMTGQGTRFQAAGYQEPKPLVKVNGRSIIERLLGVFRPQWKYIFVLADNHRGTGIEETLRSICPRGEILYQAYERKGPSWAVLSALKGIPETARILVSYCDYGMVWDPVRFEEFVRSSDCDACLVSYRGFHAHYLSPTNYAFSRMDKERVVEVREKGNFTANREDEYASAGAYYFREAKLLRFAIEQQMEQGLYLKGELYTSLTVQALLVARPESQVRIFEIPYFFQWGTPEDKENFEYWEKTMSASNRFQSSSRMASSLPNETLQLLMPMAGFGSRFQKLTKTPKPLIQIQDRAMFLHAMDSLPPSQIQHFVTKAEFCGEVEELLNLKSRGISLYEEEKQRGENTKVHGLSETPNGQALTTEQGLAYLKEHEALLISSCDHGVVLCPQLWKQFSANPRCDAAIFTIRGFPGATRRPEAYCYVDAEQATSKNLFPEIRRVSVKKPFSAEPIRERILVGTFWFSSPQLVKELIHELVAKNIRVNNEFYLDSVINLLIARGQVARVIELDGYINWGDPDSLKEALYWQEVFGGRTLKKRSSFPGTMLAE